MFGHWFETELGQIVAPDKRVETESSDSGHAESRNSFWQMVAPDPKFASPNAHNHNNSSKKNIPQLPPPSMFPPDLQGAGGTPCEEVKCIHCLKMTPVQPQVTFQTPSPTLNVTRTDLPSSGTLATPVSSLRNSQQHPPKTPQSEAKVTEAVLEAARETAIGMTSPACVANPRNNVFKLCASSKPLNDKSRKRLRKSILKSTNPSLLLSSRSSRLGNLVPDGYTPLMAAASVNNIPALEILLEFDPVRQWNERDLQGQTALHIASAAGHVEAVNMLRKVAPEEIGELAPIDLTGATPFGRAVLSKTAGARNNSEELHKSLFSPGDVSVYGDKAKKLTPLKRRTPAKLPIAAATPASVIGGDGMPNNGYIEGLQMSYGLADMPGYRILMEDAICFDFWTTMPTTATTPEKQPQSETHALLGVCDGHGDAGMCSEFIAENASTILRSMDEYEKCNYIGAFKQAYPKLDVELKGQKFQGGTTAAIALVTPAQIIVANVGDSRCILIQSSPTESSDSTADSLEISMANMAVNDNQEGESQSKATAEKDSNKADISEEKPEIMQSSTIEIKHKSHTVKPLSEDHKPCLEMEKARIEKAGLRVVEESFTDDDGQEVTISKVQLNDSERMAVSRSFGDFEYKENTSLPEAEQAVVVSPDIRVHARSDNDLYLVLACDGIWDVMTSDQVGDFVVNKIEELKKEGGFQGANDNILARVGDMLLSECFDRKSRDNLTVVVTALSKEADEIGGRRLEIGKALNFADE